MDMQLITVKQASEIMSVNIRTVYDLIKTEGFPAVTLGNGGKKSYRIDAVKLKDWIDRGGNAQ